MRDKVIGAGFRMMRLSGLDRALAGVTRGMGAILMFHHVRAATAENSDYAPNGLLEITPEFFDRVLSVVRGCGFDVVTLDGAIARLRAPAEAGRPFAVLTFDDGYRDTRDCALPIMRKHGVPFTVYVTTGFADRTARLWWKELELAIARTSLVEVVVDGQQLRMSSQTGAEKTRAFNTLYRYLRAGPEERLLNVIASLCDRYGVNGRAIVEDLCMSWDEIRTLAQDPGCTIGVHTCTHPMLAKHDAEKVRRELSASRAQIETVIGKPAVHLAYPVGDVTSAAAREFALAGEAGFTSAVTTRPGMIFPEHADHLTALPRLSINGRWQDVRHVEALLSGAPFALWNRGRRLNVA